MRNGGPIGTDRRLTRLFSGGEPKGRAKSEPGIVAPSM